MALDQESFDILLPTLQRFIQERLVPAENYLEEHDDVPADIVEDMKEMGLFGLSIPEEFGGLGLSMAEEVRLAMLFGESLDRMLPPDQDDQAVEEVAARHGVQLAKP